MSEGLTTYANGVATIASGANQLSNRSADLVGGVQELTQSGASIETLVNGTANLNSGLTTLKQSVDLSLANNQENIQTLSESLTQLNASIQSSLVDTSASTDTIEAALTNIATSAQAMINNSQAVKTATLTSMQGTAGSNGGSNVMCCKI